MLSEFVVPGVLISDLDKKAENFITSQGRPAFKGYMGFLQRSVFQLKMQWFMVYLEIELKEGQIVGIDCGGV